MFRLLGFIIGSAVSILTILLITGIPEFHLSNPDIDKRRFEEALEKLREKSQGARLVAADTAGQMTASVANEAEPSAMELLPEQHSVDADFVADATAAESVAVRVNDTQWHAFWNPFRSRIAAQGFVARLEEVTGLDYRIEKVDVGVYEVAFAYADDTERTWKLSQISAATGLELPES